MRPIYIILALAIYLPFEDCFLFSFHLSTTMLTVAKELSELVIYVTLAIVLALRQIKHKKVAVTGIEGLIVLFCFSGFVTTYAYGGDMFQAAINLKSLFRYFSLTLLAVNSDFTKRQLDWLIRVIVLGAAFQALLSIACVVFSPLGDAFHLLRSSNGAIPEKVGSQFGTFAIEGSAAVFYLVAMAFLFSRAYKPKFFNPTFVRWCLVGLMMLGIAVSLKRAAVFAAVAMFMMLLVIERKRVRAGLIAGAAGVALIGLMLLAQVAGTAVVSGNDVRSTSTDTFDFATELFTSDYWAKTDQDSRGWILTDILPNLLISPRITGFSADPTEAASLFVHDNPSLSHFLEYRATEDVYWAAVVLYYGQLGACLLLWILLWFATRIWMGRRYLDSVFEKEISSATIMLLLISVPYALVERLFELRSFTFYYWLFIGIAMQQYRAAKLARLIAFAAENPAPVPTSPPTRPIVAPGPLIPRQLGDASV